MIGHGPTVGAALEAVLTEERGSPMTPAEILRAYGGSKPAIARDIAGLPPGPLPRKGTPERRRYDSALRSIQRYYTEAGERRSISGALPELRGRARRVVSDAQVKQARRLGLGVRVLAQYTVSRNQYVGLLPADAGGAARFQQVPGGGLRGVLRSFNAGDVEEAGDELLGRMLALYWQSPEPLGAFTVLEAWVKL